jgi:hypothetical protein
MPSPRLPDKVGSTIRSRYIGHLKGIFTVRREPMNVGEFDDN